MNRNSLTRRARQVQDLALLMSSPLTRPRHAGARVFVMGTGRSGTTLLMRAIADGLRGAAIYEPLRPDGGRRAAGLLPPHGYLRLAPDDDFPRLAAYIADLLNGRSLTRWSASQLNVRELRGAQAVVIKEVRANRIAGWLRQHFPELKIRSVIRHPVRVIDSMLRATLGWSSMPYEMLVPPAAKALGVDSDELATRSDSQAMWLACLWIADTRCLMTELDEESLRQGTCYEHLITDPMGELQRITSGFPHFDMRDALKALSRPSATASSDFRTRGPVVELPDSLITATDLRRIKMLLTAFEIDLYTVHDPMPRRRP